MNRSAISEISEIVAQEAILAILAFESETGSCIFANHLAKEWLELGMKGGESSSLLLTDLLYTGEPLATRSARPLSKEMLESEGLFQDVVLQKQSGQRMIANVGVRRIEGADGTTRVLLMFQDITIQKKLQREIQAKQEEIHRAHSELVEQNRQLQELDEAKDKFIALTTHELRTPLSALVATADLLRRKLYSDDSQRDQLVETIAEQGDHLMNLVNDILDFAKVRAGKMEFFVEPVSLETLLKKVHRSFTSLAQQSGVQLKFAGVDARTIYVDALRFREVLANVINNAIKYNRTGGWVDVAVINEDARVLVRIQDSGIGIPKEKMHHVFNEFETVGRLSGHHRGTGLGMPISKRYMNAMGGQMTVESEEGVGTTFIIEVPTERVLDEKMYGTRGDWQKDFAD